MDKQIIRANVIPPVTKTTIPNSIVVFDTESKKPEIKNGKEYQTLKLIVGRYIRIDEKINIIKDETQSFEDTEGFVGWLETLSLRDKKLTIYAHNLKYDLQLSGVLQKLIKRGWETKAFVLEDAPNFVRISRDRYTMQFVDTFNYWQFGISKMGEQIGMPKLQMPVGMIV